LTTNSKAASKSSHVITKPKTSSEENKRVDEVKALVLQAYRNQVRGGGPARVWQSVQLTKNKNAIE
jgi:hypothetical protein